MVQFVKPSNRRYVNAMDKVPVAAVKAIARCQICETEYPERDAAKEVTYKCLTCGARGYDCCVPGNNSACVNCEENQD